MRDSRLLGLRVLLVVSCGAVALAAHIADASGRLYFLDIRGGRIVSAAPDGSDVKVLISGRTGIPDGVAVDQEAGHIYWTIMGRAAADDGMIERIDSDGSHLTTVVPAGGTFTPKQLKLDPVHRKLYWSDREGMRVMRANLDGSQIETLVETGHGDADRRDAQHWCVGIALDLSAAKIYWTQKGGDNAGVGSLRRANLEIPRGEDPAHRSDIEVLFDKLPEPIDVDLDLTGRMIYWTDRGSNTVSRAAMDRAGSASRSQSPEPQIVMTDLKEAIGIALDVPADRMYVTDLGGTVYRARLDGSDKRVLLTGQGSLTGIAFVGSR